MQIKSSLKNLQTTYLCLDQILDCIMRGGSDCTCYKTTLKDKEKGVDMNKVVIKYEDSSEESGCDIMSPSLSVHQPIVVNRSRANVVESFIDEYSSMSAVCMDLR